MYYQPDITWNGFGIKTQEEYLQKFVIKSNFHNAVHEDVIKSYKTVEFLMAHAYYHYPMFDEAKKKLLHIVEMAVKLRSKELGNSLTFETRNGRTRKKTLNQLIDELKQFGYTDKFISKLNWMRNNRNRVSHPEHHSYSGGMFKYTLYPIINGLNELFLSPTKLVEIESELEKYKDSKNLKGLYKVPYKNKLVLGYDPEVRHCWSNNNTWECAVYFQPVLTKTKELLKEHKIPAPILFFLSNLVVTKSGIEATNIEIAEKINFDKTTKSENISQYNKHISELKELNDTAKFAYRSSHNSSISHSIELVIYNSWNNR